MVATFWNRRRSSAVSAVLSVISQATTESGLASSLIARSDA